MSNTARKARKRAGIPFERAPKKATPILERFIPMTFDPLHGLRTSARKVRRNADQYAATRRGFSLAASRRSRGNK